MRLLDNINSSVIDEIGYEDKTAELFVKFKGDKASTYKYVNVPVEIFNILSTLTKEGKSVGQYYTRSIKGKFQGVKM